MQQTLSQCFLQAYKLYGDILVGMKNNNEAIRVYKKSIEVNEKQPELMLQIVELIIDQIGPEDKALIDEAHYWLDRYDKFKIARSKVKHTSYYSSVFV